MERLNFPLSDCVGFVLTISAPFVLRVCETTHFGRADAVRTGPESIVLVLQRLRNRANSRHRDLVTIK